MNPKKVEVKSIGIGSLFKAICYLMVIPVAIYVVIGLFFVLAAILSGKVVPAVVGLLFIILCPVVIIGLYGGLGSLVCLVYNFLAKKYGGLEVNIIEDSNNATITPTSSETKVPLFHEQTSNPMLSNLYESSSQEAPPGNNNENQ